mgnify:CR=1 FL=1
MIINFKKVLSIGLVTVVILGGTIFWGLNQVKPVEASPSMPTLIEKLQVQENKVERDGWDMTFTRITICTLPNDSTKKLVSVTFTLADDNGTDKTLTPKGKLIGIVGNSGKEYDFTLDSLDTLYVKTQKSAQMIAQREGKTFAPGNSKITVQIYVEPIEQSINTVIYQDENGNNFEVPISLVTETLKNGGVPGGK